MTSGDVTWIKGETKKLRLLGQSAPSGRTALREYLQKVYEVAWELKKKASATDEALRLLSNANSSKRSISSDVHPFRVILDLTCATDEKRKSKWFRGLRWLWEQKIKPKQFMAELDEMGGISKCADAWARHREEEKEKDREKKRETKKNRAHGK